jgi:hypothetical protein
MDSLLEFTCLTTGKTAEDKILRSNTDASLHYREVSSTPGPRQGKRTSDLSGKSTLGLCFEFAIWGLVWGLGADESAIFDSFALAATLVARIASRLADDNHPHTLDYSRRDTLRFARP